MIVAGQPQHRAMNPARVLAIQALECLTVARRGRAYVIPIVVVSRNQCRWHGTSVGNASSNHLASFDAVASH
jgi:hypothetical protein